jgi:hypothetical protein
MTGHRQIPPQHNVGPSPRFRGRRSGVALGRPRQPSSGRPAHGGILGDKGSAAGDESEFLASGLEVPTLQFARHGPAVRKNKGDESASGPK